MYIYQNRPIFDSPFHNQYQREKSYYTAAPSLMRMLQYKLADCKGKIQCTVLYELAILLTHFMKEYFNSFDDIQFFHTFSSISRDM